MGSILMASISKSIQGIHFCNYLICVEEKAIDNWRNSSGTQWSLDTTLGKEKRKKKSNQFILLNPNTKIQEPHFGFVFWTPKTYFNKSTIIKFGSSYSRRIKFKAIVWNSYTIKVSYQQLQQPAALQLHP